MRSTVLCLMRLRCPLPKKWSHVIFYENNGEKVQPVEGTGAKCGKTTFYQRFCHIPPGISLYILFYQAARFLVLSSLHIYGNCFSDILACDAVRRSQVVSSSPADLQTTQRRRFVGVSWSRWRCARHELLDMAVMIELAAGPEVKKGLLQFGDDV